MKLSSKEIKNRLSGLNGWKEENSTLMKTYRFPSYMDGVKFVGQVAEAAEEANHHPDLLLRYGQVEVRLTTHDAGGISEKDFQLAQVIETLTG